MSELENARAEAAKHRAEFLKAHREACIALGLYCAAMEKAQRLTSATASPLLGGNPEEENRLAALLVKEPPIAAVKREGAAQSTNSASNPAAVPRLVKFGGCVRDDAGHTRTGAVGVQLCHLQRTGRGSATVAGNAECAGR
jgi:hypothetical protein